MPRPIIAAGPDTPALVLGTMGDDDIIVVANEGQTLSIYPGPGNDTVRVVGSGSVVIYDDSGSGDDTYILTGGNVRVVYGADVLHNGVVGNGDHLGQDRIENFTPGEDVLDFSAIWPPLQSADFNTDGISDDYLLVRTFGENSFIITEVNVHTVEFGVDILL